MEGFLPVENSTAESLHSLASVAKYLHAEGFYAAEAALLRDIELRFPAAVSMSRRASSNISEADWPAVPTATSPAGNSHPSEPVVLLTQPVSAGDARRHSRPPAISPTHSRQSSGRCTPVSPRSPPGIHPQQGLPAHLDVHSFSSGKPRVDEYSDDEDVGYFTIPVTRQDEFVLTELQLSDDEGSPTRSSYGYHRHRPRTPDEARWGGSGQPSLPAGIGSSSDGGGGFSRLGSDQLSRPPNPLQRQLSGASSAASRLGNFAVHRTPSPGVSPAAGGLAHVSSLAAQLAPKALSSGSSAGNSAAGTPHAPAVAAPGAETAAALPGIAVGSGSTAQREASEEAAVAVGLAAAAAQSAGREAHVQSTADEVDEDKWSVDSLVLPGEGDLPSVAGNSSAASEGGGMPESPACSTTAEAGSVILTLAASEALADARGSPSKRLLPQPPSAAASPAASMQPLPLLPPVRPLHHRRLDPLTQTQKTAPLQQPPPAPLLSHPVATSSSAGEEPVDVLIGDNISALPPQQSAVFAQPSMSQLVQPAAAAARLAAAEQPEPAAAQPPSGSPVSGSNGFGSFIRSRNVIGRVAEKLHLSSRSSSSGFASGGRPSRHPQPDMAAQEQQQSQPQQQQLHHGSNLKPQPGLPPAGDQQQQHTGPPSAPAGKSSEQQQVLHGSSQARSKSSASSSRMPTLDGGTTSSTTSDSGVSDAHKEGEVSTPTTPAGEGTAFSFPVTPPSDPPPPPQAVFKGWSSFKENLGRRRDFNLQSGSDYSATDDELGVERSGNSTPTSPTPSGSPVLQHAFLDPTGADRRSAFAQSRAPQADATATNAQHSPFSQAAAGGGPPQGGWAPMANGAGSGGISSAGLSSGYSSAAHSRTSSRQSRAGSRELGAAPATSAAAAAAIGHSAAVNAAVAAAARAAPPAQQHVRQRDGVSSRSMDFTRQHSQGTPDRRPTVKSASMDESAWQRQAGPSDAAFLAGMSAGRRAAWPQGPSTVPPTLQRDLHNGSPLRPGSQQQGLRAAVHKFGSLRLTPAERDAAMLAAGLASALEDSDAGDSVADAQHTHSGGSVASPQLPHAPAAGRDGTSDARRSSDFPPEWDVLTLRCVHRKRSTGFEDTKEMSLQPDDVIAGRYQVMEHLGAAAFSRAVQARDLRTGALVCLKVVKNNKDYFDQSLDEVKLLRAINDADPHDAHGILRLYDFFYYREHLVLVCELLRANLFEFQRFTRASEEPPYFTLPRVRSIARQVLRSLAFLHSLDLIHADLKPENILIKSYSRCEVKVIDMGSSCYTSDVLSSYVQSRAYRAPEVILGLPYGQAVDIWSLGCILAELLSGSVLLQNSGLATLLARLEGIFGPVPEWMQGHGRYAHRFYTRAGALYRHSSRTGQYDVLRPKRTTLAARVPAADEGCIEFLSALLTVDPSLRPTAAQALQHPWLAEQQP